MAKGGKRPGAGRPRGSQNKFNADVKDMILTALNGAGGAAYLQQQAIQNPSAFMSLVGKVLPMQVNHGDPNGEKLEGFQVILVGKAG